MCTHNGRKLADSDVPKICGTEMFASIYVIVRQLVMLTKYLTSKGMPNYPGHLALTRAGRSFTCLCSFTCPHPFTCPTSLVDMPLTNTSIPCNVASSQGGISNKHKLLSCILHLPVLCSFTCPLRCLLDAPSQTQVDMPD